MLKWNRDGDGHRGRSDAWLETRTDGYPADRTRATPTDIIAALKANPEACAEVLAGMGTTHFAARDAEWWHDRFLAEKARAEQAEHSLAASERALAALRYQAQAGGCELSTVGENSYHCRADALCGLCRLRHRAEQAERERDAWRAKWEALETTRASCCDQMERERDEARAAHDELKGKLAEAVAEACGLAADDITHVASAAANTLRRLVRERNYAMTLAEERRDYARAQNAKLSVECDDLRAQLTAVERERDEAHAALRDCATRLENGSAVSPKASHAFHCAVATEVGIVVPALRAKLAKTERVVEAARQHLRCDLTDTESISAEHALQNALRALDSPVGGSSVDPRPLCIRCAKPWVPLEGCDATVELCPACWYRGERPGVAGTDSEGGAPCTGQVTPGTVSGGASGAATPEGGHAAPTGGPMPPPEPAGSSCRCGAGCKPVPRYAGDDDSPVGVAATESNEGLIPSGACRPDPPPDYLTRSELVSAVRSAASAVGGPPRRALDALADALEIPRT